MAENVDKDRVKIDRDVAEYIQGELATKNPLGFGEKGSRTDLYTLAVALGANEERQIPSDHTLGFIQVSTLTNSDIGNKNPSVNAGVGMSYLYSVALEELRKEAQENNIIDDEKVFGIVEKYANGGIKILQDMITSAGEYDEDALMFGMVGKMDEVYADINKASEK